MGGGIVVHGRVLTGRNAIAGEWGHNPLPWPTDAELPGPQCYCGKRGCIETFLSGPAIARDHLCLTGDEAMPQAIIARSEAGDGPCLATVERYEGRLARCLAHVINILDPDVIVLGMPHVDVRRLYETVPRLSGRCSFLTVFKTPLVQAQHGDSSGVRGAAFLAMGETTEIGATEKKERRFEARPAAWRKYATHPDIYCTLSSPMFATQL